MRTGQPHIAQGQCEQRGIEAILRGDHSANPNACGNVSSAIRWLSLVAPPLGKRAGKTYTGARLAVDLIRRGRRVGVAASSHKPICKLLEEIEAAADEAGVEFRGLQKCGGDDCISGSDRIEPVTSPGDCANAGDDVDLIAGTPWLWARQDMRGKVDVLFVDEAGHMSLADACAISQGASSLVLLGDPQQLAHVSQGTHPRDSGRSVLEHLLGDRDTVPADRGVFLSRTWRMEPELCRFVSDAMYDGRLETIDGLDLQAIDSPGLAGAGLRMLPVEHFDNRVSSTEAAAIARQFERLLDGGRWRDCHGVWHDLTLQDILVVAPYNAQVRCLRARLPEGARVGTVDKFQGQEAPVVFFSMASSSGEDVPRGLNFLFQPQPAERRGLASSGHDRRRLLSAAAARPLLDAGADAPREHAVPLRPRRDPAVALADP